MSQAGDQALWRQPEVLVDVGVVVVLTVAIELQVWSPTNIGDPIAGPRWLTACLPLLITLPLLMRRHRPLLAWLLVLSGVVLQAVVSQNSAEGLEILFPLAIGSYSVAAYADRLQAVIGLVALLVGWSIFAIEDRNVRTGSSSQLWATAFFAAAMVASWLIGAFVSSRRETARIAERADALERAGKEAVAAERLRVARDLHDIVSHNLSVVVLQAAGARAKADGQPADSSASLERIEDSAREALHEMRRMLGVLRTDGEARGLSPQPGLSDVTLLVDGVRGAGLPVDVEMHGDLTDVPAVVALSAYRIVQEALTNTLKHAASTHATVRIDRTDDALLVEVVDDGIGAASPASAGHGLIGMSERTALLGGEFDAHPGADGGFVVRARIPMAGAVS